MAPTGNNGARRKKILLLVTLALAVVLALQFSGLSVGELPTRAAIDQEAKSLRNATKQLRKLSRQNVRQDQELTELKDLAAPFWQVSGRVAEQEVREELDRLARRAKVSLPRIQNPRKKSLQGYDYIDEVELTISWTATMKEITRFLYEIEKSERVFQWTECSIRPMNPRAPKEVRLTGKLRALILNTEAQTILAGGKEEAK
jgi:Tfp pilus assembly protein PilO